MVCCLSSSERSIIPPARVSRAEKHPQIVFEVAQLNSGEAYLGRRMEPSRICVAWQKRSSPPPSSGRMKPNPLWFQAMQTPVLRGPPSPPNSPLLGAPPASRAPGLRERRGGLRERGRGSSLRGGERSAISFVARLASLRCRADAVDAVDAVNERLAAVNRCRARGSPQQSQLFVRAANLKS